MTTNDPSTRFPTLNNGAVIVEAIRMNRDERIVLARWGDQWVTWSVSNEGDAYNGHYFAGLIIAATADLAKRAGLAELLENA